MADDIERYALLYSKVVAAAFLIERAEKEKLPSLLSDFEKCLNEYEKEVPEDLQDTMQDEIEFAKETYQTKKKDLEEKL